MKSVVISTCSVNGFHAWPDAPADLAYLSTRHRHAFYFKVEVRVGHDNRQVEFHQLQRAARYFLEAIFPKGGNGGEFEFGSRSCEMIASELLQRMVKEGWTVTAIEVWEDNECGGRVEA